MLSELPFKVQVKTTRRASTTFYALAGFRVKHDPLSDTQHKDRDNHSELDMVFVTV
jgi:hypothetical protein